MNGERNNESGVPRGARLWFGIFMVLIYLGIGLMFILNIFSIDNSAISITVGVILVLYGIWRGYRLARNMN